MLGPPTPDEASCLRAALALCGLTLVMTVAMYATRLPAMARLRVRPQLAAHARALDSLLPSEVRRVSDNYNHLMEAPTVFYAAVLAVVLLGVADRTAARLAWMYVALRAVHSLVQSTCNVVELRFALFALSWVVLGAIIVRGGAAAAAAA